jgi:hypothetical protein
MINTVLRKKNTTNNLFVINPPFGDQFDYTILEGQLNTLTTTPIVTNIN